MPFPLAQAKKGKKEAGEQIEEQSQNAQAATSQQLDGFKKSFSVCLEAKKYMVKF